MADSAAGPAVAASRRRQQNIFVSYARQDRGRIESVLDGQRLHDDLSGGQAWWDTISLNVRREWAAAALAWTSFAVSLVVALSAALESFFHDGGRWRSFRRTSEALKAQGWQFFELGGPYATLSSHTAAFPVFVAQVELLVQQDLEAFVAAQAQTARAADAAPPEKAIPTTP